MRRFTTVLFLILLPQAAAAETWDKVNAVFQTRCIMCHSGEGAPLGLHLDSHAGVMKGSENGAVVKPGDPDESPIIHRLLGKAEPRMPLDGPPFLEPDTIAMIAAWIKAGAPGEDTAAAAPAAPVDPRADGKIVYSEVSRIFGQHCVKCHSDNSKMGAPPEGLRLGSLADILKGGGRVVLIPGNPQGSEIIRRVEGRAMPRMPFDGPPWLTEGEIALLRDWIAGGALNDEGVAAAIPVGGRLRMRGELTAADAIGGSPFVTTGGTRIRKAPQTGQQAEMRGHVGAAGEVVADDLRGR